MQIRRYTGSELAAVLKEINRELGPNAAILNTRKIRIGGIFGFLGRPAVEVTVAVDYNFKINEDALGRPTPAASLSAATSAEKAGRVLAVPGPAHPAASPATLASTEEVRLTAREELNQMRVTPRSGVKGRERLEVLSDELERVYRVMVRNQVEADISRQLLRVFDEQLALLGEDWSRSQPRLERYLAGMIRTIPGIQLREGRKPLMAMFIGPTGSGKTTTIAKIAAHFALMEHRRVGIVTADTYRMGATDQIRRYGEILGIPVRVVETPEEIERCSEQFSGYDLVLIDTAGRSPQNREQIMQMKQLVESAHPDEIHLVVSMTTKYVDVVSIVSRFGIVPVHRLVLTKIDETRTFGLILNISMKFSMEIAYITTGQQVPDDLELADPARLAKLVLSGVWDQDGRPGLTAA